MQLPLSHLTWPIKVHTSLKLILDKFTCSTVQTEVQSVVCNLLTQKSGFSMKLLFKLRDHPEYLSILFVFGVLTFSPFLSLYSSA